MRMIDRARLALRRPLQFSTHGDHHRAMANAVMDPIPKRVYSDHLRDEGYPAAADAYTNMANHKGTTATARTTDYAWGQHPNGAHILIGLRMGTQYKPESAHVIITHSEHQRDDDKGSGVVGDYVTPDLHHVRSLMDELHPIVDGDDAGRNQDRVNSLNRIRGHLSMEPYQKPVEQFMRPRGMTPVAPADGDPHQNWQHVASSWIAGLKYTPGQGATMVTKKGGREYTYPGITKAMFRDWLARQSKGKWWWKNIGYPMRDAIHASRWTGPVHPLFQNNAADGPVDWGEFSTVKHDQALAWLRTHISPKATKEHMAAMIGWVPGTKVNSYYHTPSGQNVPDALTTEVSDEKGQYNAHRTIHAADLSTGKPYIENELMTIPRDVGSPYRGVSGPVWLRQIRSAYEMGIPAINFFAAYEEPHDVAEAQKALSLLFPGLEPPTTTQEPFTGGLHWPMMGADGVLSPTYIKTIPKDILDEVHQMSGGRFQNSRAFRDFFTSPAARDYYEENPISHHGFIDTTPGSYSRKAIERHVAKKSLAHGLPIPIPDQMMPKKPLHLAARGRYPMHIEHLLATGDLHPDFFDAYFDR